MISSRPGARRLFLIVIGLTAFHALVPLLDHRVPLGHETGRLFDLEYRWAWGEAEDAASWVEQGTLLQNVLAPLAPAIRSASFLPFFHLGLFVEELVFLAGVWLLGTRVFRSPRSVFLVSVAALGTCLWVDNAATNLLAFSALPLLVYLAHEFLESGNRSSLFWAGLLALLQVLGRPPVFALLTPAAACLYFAGATLVFGYPLRDRWTRIAWRERDLATAAALVLALGLLTRTALSFPRTEDPAASGEWFSAGAVLTGAGLGNPGAFADALLGFAPGLDATFFCGTLTIALAAAALRQMGRRRALRLLAFLLASCLVLGVLPLVTGALLRLPPPSRPTVQGLPLLRLVAIFLAGFGFDEMQELRALGAPLPRFPGAALLLTSGVLAVFYVYNPYGESLAVLSTDLLARGIPPEAASPFPSQMPVFQNLAGTAALMTGLAGACLLGWSAGGRGAPFALALLLVLHPLDTFGWKFRMTWMKSCELSPARAASLKLSAPSEGADLDPLVPPKPARLLAPYGIGPTPLRSGGEPTRIGILRWGVAGLSAILIAGVLGRLFAAAGARSP